MALIKVGVLFILTAMLCSTSAVAATSQWHDHGGGKVRLVVYADPTNSEINGVVEVQLEPGWSTYWRYPGSSGIPPTFDFSRSKGFLNSKISKSSTLKIVGWWMAFRIRKNQVRLNNWVKMCFLRRTLSLFTAVAAAISLTIFVLSLSSAWAAEIKEILAQLSTTVRSNNFCGNSVTFDLEVALKFFFSLHSQPIHFLFCLSLPHFLSRRCVRSSNYMFFLQ